MTKARAKQATRKRRARYVVGYVGTGNVIYGQRHSAHIRKPDIWAHRDMDDGARSEDTDRDVLTSYPLTLKQAQHVLSQMPCGGCAIFELVPVEVNR